MKNNFYNQLPLISIKEVKQSFNYDKSLTYYLDQLVDPRKNKHLIVYSITDVVFQSILATMSCCNSYREKAEFGFTNFANSPVVSTLQRILALIDPDELNIVLSKWMMEVNRKLNINIFEAGHLSVDGKVLRNYTESHFESNEQDSIQLVSLFCSKLKQTIASYVFNSSDSSESETARDLIDLVSKEYSIGLLTGDALHLSVKTLALLKSKKIPFLFSIKNNTPKLLSELKLHSSLISTLTVKLNSKTTKLIKVYSVPEDFKLGIKGKRYSWDDLDISTYLEVTTFDTKKRKLTKAKKQQRRKEKKKGKQNVKASYPLKNLKIYKKQYISSIKSNLKTPKEFLEMIASHWSIENLSHRERDVVFKEDDIKSKHPALVKNLSSMITAVMNIFSTQNFKSMKQATQYSKNRLSYCIELLHGKKAC